MSKKSNESKTPAAPATPTPQSEFFLQDGVVKSQRVYDKNNPLGKNAYTTQTFSTPDEQAIENKATGFISNLVDQVPNVFSMDPGQIAAQREAYAAPQRRALTDSYNEARGSLENAAAGAGMRNSIGFNRYLADRIEKNKAQGLADIEDNATQYQYNLPRMALAPYTDAFNLVNAALSGQQANTMNNVQPAFAGSQAASNFGLSNYGNQVQQYQLNNQRPQQQSGGFFSRLFGGF